MAADVSFAQTTWIAGSAPGISAAQLNRIEEGIDDLATQFSSHNGGTAVSDHPNVTTSTRGFMSDPDKVKLNGIATGATTDQTAAEILAALLTVDGSGSGLSADNLDGLNSSASSPGRTQPTTFYASDSGAALWLLQRSLSPIQLAAGLSYNYHQ